MKATARYKWGTGRIILYFAHPLTMDKCEDLVLTGSATNPSKITWKGDNYDVEWSMSADKDISAVTYCDFTDLTPGAIYKISYNITTTVITALRLRFNGDDGNNYGHGYHLDGRIAGVEEDSCESNINQNYLRIGELYNYNFGEITFGTRQGDNQKVHAMFKAFSVFDTDDFMSSRGGGWWNGSSDLTSARLYVPAGTMTGKVFLTRIA